MSYLKTAYAHGQADALAALGIKQAALGQTLMGGLESAAGRMKSLFGGAARAGETQIGHVHPPSGVQLKAPQDLIPQHIKDLGAQNRTITGELRDLSQTPFEAMVAARPRPEPVNAGAAVKANPTREYGKQMSQLDAIQGGQRPVGSEDLLNALPALNSGGLDAMTGGMAAAPVAASHHGGAFIAPEVLQEREKWDSLLSAFGDLDAAAGKPVSRVGKVPAPRPAPTGLVDTRSWAADL